jgi:hypothetical protein
MVTRAICGMKIARGYRSTRRKPVPAPLCPPQIPHDPTRARTRAVAVGSQRLTAWAMARPRPLYSLAVSMENVCCWRVSMENGCCLRVSMEIVCCLRSNDLVSKSLQFPFAYPWLVFKNRISAETPTWHSILEVCCPNLNQKSRLLCLRLSCFFFLSTG